VRKVVAYTLLSLDDVAEAPEQFFMDYWSDAVEANMASLIATQDAVILGRRSYDEWATFWPESNIEPFASFINGTAKYVATSRPLELEWANSTPIDGDLVASVRALQDRSCGDIGIHASISIVQALLGAGVVDELALAIAPVIVGSGRRLLDEVPFLRLELVRSSTSPSGVLMASYRVVR